MHPLTEEAMHLLDGGGAILETARAVSVLIRNGEIDAAVIGGVAVVLHGHVRTTVDVDVYTTESQRMAQCLTEAGFAFDTTRREFRATVPVHLVTPRHVRGPVQYEDRQGVRTVALSDLINMKLRSGTKDVLRAQDLADVIGLICANELDGAFTPQIDAELRGEFRTLVQRINGD